MDKKYETMFDKLQQAIDKLERRKCQVTELKLVCNFFLPLQVTM